MTADDERSAGALAAVTYDHDDDTVLVIIGSGAAGGTLADELTGKGINVVILEAGRRFDLSERREMRRIATVDDVHSLGEVGFEKAAA